jgi:predicted RNA-binding protein Jag
MDERGIASRTESVGVAVPAIIEKVSGDVKIAKEATQIKVSAAGDKMLIGTDLKTAQILVEGSADLVVQVRTGTKAADPEIQA